MTKTAATKFQVRWRKNDEPDTLWSSPVDVGTDGNVKVPGLDRVTDYVFQARAGSDCGAWSDWIVQTFNIPDATAPSAVTSLTAQSVADGVHLAWASIIADGGTKFAIERSASADSGFAERARTTATAYTDPETSGTTYYYRVRAVNYRGSFGPYSNVVSSQGVAVDELGDDVAAAQTAAENAQHAADAANAQLADIASDNVLSPAEKPNVARDYAIITTEQAGIDGQATAYSITTEKTTYDSAVSALTAYLATLTTPVAWNDKSDNTTIVGTTFKSKFTTVYTARQTLLNKIYAVAKSIADAAQTTANTATALASQVAVLNPGFDAGDTGWTKGTGWSIKSDGSFGHGSGYAERVGGSDGAIRNNAVCFVQPGHSYKVQALIKAIGANGQCYARISWRDLNDSEIGTTNGDLITGTTVAGSFAVGVPPAGAVFAHAEIAATSHTTGKYQVDNVISTLQPATADEIAETAGKKWAGESGADKTSTNLDFLSVKSLAENGSNLAPKGDWLDGQLGGWSVAGPGTATPGISTSSQPFTKAMTFGGGNVSGLTATTVRDGSTFIPVRGGEVLQFLAWGICRNGFSSIQIGVLEYDATQTYLRDNFSDTALVPSGYKQVRGKVTISPDAVYTTAAFRVTGTSDGSDFAPSMLAYVLQRSDGIGIPGSGLTIGDQRNLPALTYAGVSSMPTSQPLSYSISGTTITFVTSAFAMNRGTAGPVSYSAASASRSDQSAGTTRTYYAFFIDHGAQGGSKPLQVTAFLSTLAASDDNVFVGMCTVTIASGGGGSSGTGGGGGGVLVPPGGGYPVP